MAQAIAQYVIPVLEALKKLGGSARVSEVRDEVARAMGLSDEALNTTLSSGRSRFENSLRWVRSHLAYAGYLERSARGVWTLTEKGRNTQRLSEAEVDQLLLGVQRGGTIVRALSAAGLKRLQIDDDEAPEDAGYGVQLLGCTDCSWLF